MTAQIPIGLLAGLVSAVLFGSANTGTVLGLMILFMLSPMPIAVAGLGWGWRAAAVAALAGALIIAVGFSPRAALFFFLTLGLPAAVLSYFMLLNREWVDDTGTTATEWFPIGRVVGYAALWAGALAAFALLTTADSVDALQAQIRPIVERMFKVPADKRPPGMPEMTREQLDQITSLMTASFPGVTATIWFMIGLLNLWLGGLVAQKSGRLARPWPELSLLAMPRPLPLVLAGTILFTFLPGMTGLVATGFASAIIIAYMLVGLAIVHRITLGKSNRGLILGAVYASLMFANPFSGLGLAVVGLAENFSPLRRNPLPPPGSP
jgi:hypothetical protein